MDMKYLCDYHSAAGLQQHSPARLAAARRGQTVH